MWQMEKKNLSDHWFVVRDDFESREAAEKFKQQWIESYRTPEHWLRVTEKK